LVFFYNSLIIWTRRCRVYIGFQPVFLVDWLISLLLDEKGAPAGPRIYIVEVLHTGSASDDNKNTNKYYLKGKKYSYL
jgi:hypothetical protein